MRLLEFVARCFVGWSVLSCICACAWSVAATRMRSRTVRPAVEQPPAYPPPIAPSRPRITQRDVDATWLDPWPVQDAVSTALRFEQIAEANHFHEFLPGKWTA